MTAPTVEHPVPAYPYGPVYVHGVRVWPDDDLDLHDMHPQPGEAPRPLPDGVEGYRVGGAR
jgi:hypothetical protein